AGAFTMNYYLSSNSDQTGTNYFLGSSSVSSLSQLNFATTGWSGTFPSRIPKGSYYLTWFIDAGGTVSEFTENNQIGYMKSSLITVADDGYESNNTLATATDISGSEGSVFTLQQYDDDWFKIAASPADDRRIIASLNFTHADGDVDLQLTNTSGTVLTQSSGTGNSETIDFTVPAGGTYYLRTYYGNTGNRYTLTWNDFRVSIAPSDINISNTTIPENSPGGTAVGNLSTADGNVSDSFTYTLLNSASGRFTIVGNQVRVVAGADLNYEVTPTHTIRVRTTDSDGLTFEKDLIVTLTNVNEAPTLSSIANPSGLEDTLLGPINFTVADVDTALTS
ncbi:MAG: cadherin repeat domain-containing protein, partial [Gemmataceae bacterium]